jgi:Tol biopolymer transport system component
MDDLQHRYFMGPKLSPDGDRIAMWIAGGNPQVWVYETERGVLTPLTSEGQNFWPAWSPDGKRLAFPSIRSGRTGLFWKSADGAGSAERFTTSEYVQQPFSWSPDGESLVFHQSLDPNTGWDIWVLPMDGDQEPEPFLKTPSNEFQPALSPDGRWLAYVSNESRSDEIYVTSFPAPGGKWRISTDGGREPAWNPRGGELFYRDNERLMAVEITTQPEFRPGRPQVLFEGPYEMAPPYGRNYDVASDGERFLMMMPSEPETGPTQIHVVLNWFEELERLVPTN